MTVQEAYYKIAVNRRLEKEIREETNRLKEFIREQHADPETNLIKRNDAIYAAWKNGQNFKQLSAEFKLSSTTISSICKRIESTDKRRKMYASVYGAKSILDNSQVEITRKY